MKRRWPSRSRTRVAQSPTIKSAASLTKANAYRTIAPTGGISVLGSTSWTRSLTPTAAASTWSRPRTAAPRSASRFPATLSRSKATVWNGARSPHQNALRPRDGFRARLEAGRETIDLRLTVADRFENHGRERTGHVQVHPKLRRAPTLLNREGPSSDEQAKRQP